MSFPLVINGTTYPYPNVLDTNWGPFLINWSTAVTNGMLQSGGSTPATFVKSAGVNPAQSGIFRLANNEGVTWRNFLNSADLTLKVDASNNLLFNGVAVGNPTTLTNTHILVGNGSNVPTDVAMSGDVHITNTGVTTIQSGAVTGSKIASNTVADGNMVAGTLTDASVNASAAITLSKLAGLTANKALKSDAFGVIAPSAVTATELGFVSGASSNIQAQLNAITAAGSFQPGMGMPFFGSAIPAGWLLCDGSAVSRSTYSSLFGVIGITYGPGDGSTTFNLPQGVNYTMVGQGGSIAASLGTAAGATSVTPTSQSHTHTENTHTHDLSTQGTTGYTTAVGVGSDQANFPNKLIAFTSGGGVTGTNRGFTTGNQSDTGMSSTVVTMNASSVVQPSLGINWIIKT